MDPNVKEYSDVLILAGGMTQSTIKAFEDGKNWTDVFPIITENMDKALDAIKDADKITAAWRDHTKECVELTTTFVIDQLFDILKYKKTTASYDKFPETKDVLDAVEGLAKGAVKRKE